MASTLFFRLNSGRQHWAADSTLAGETQQVRTGRFQTSRGAAVTTLSVFTVAGPATVQLCRQQTPAFNADVTISGSIGYNLWGLETSMSANASFAIEFLRLQPNGTVTSILTLSNTTELGTSNAVRTGSGTPTSTDFKKGDSLGVEVYITDAGGTMASGHSVQFDIAGGTAGATGDSFITLTEDVTFTTATPSGSRLYLLDAASDLGGSGQKDMQIGGAAPAAYEYETNTVNGPTSPIQCTETAGGTTVDWFSPPLQAVTIAGGLWQFVFDGYATNTAANAIWLLNLYKVDQDGTNPVHILSYYHNGATSDTQGEMTTTAGTSPITATFAVRETVLTNGQRLRAVLSIDDGAFTGVHVFGDLQTSIPMATGHQAVLQGGTSDALSLLLPTTVAEFTATPTSRRPRQRNHLVFR